MPDANVVWGGDLNATPTGDVSLTDGTMLGQQRILRRLLTNPKDYTWQPDYGGGLGQFVGQAANARAVEGAIRTQILKELVVARTPEPRISTTQSPDGSVFVNITYADEPSAGMQTLSFAVGI